MKAASALSVVVRWGPVRTAMNGTIVARLARMTLLEAWQFRQQLDRRVRLDPGDACLVGKGHWPAAGFGLDSKPPPRAPAAEVRTSIQGDYLRDWGAAKRPYSGE